MQPSEKTDYAPLAKPYAQHRKPHPVVLARLREQLRPDSRVLELGCGTGNFITSLRSQVGCDCVGIDPSAEMLAQLRARGSDVKLLQNSAERLELPAESFDLVYSVDVIHHVADRNAYFRGALDALAPGGRICTVTDSAEDIVRRSPLSTSPSPARPRGLSVTLAASRSRTARAKAAASRAEPCTCGMQRRL